MAVLKELILIISTLVGFSGLKRIDYNSVYFGKVWWS